jgi:hypothetical protein
MALTVRARDLGLRAFFAFADPDLEGSEPPQFDDAAFSQRSFDLFNEEINNRMDVLAIRSGLDIDRIDDVGFCQLLSGHPSPRIAASQNKSR